MIDSNSLELLVAGVAAGGFLTASYIDDENTTRQYVESGYVTTKRHWLCRLTSSIGYSIGTFIVMSHVLPESDVRILLLLVTLLAYSSDFIVDKFLYPFLRKKIGKRKVTSNDT